jgi:hypothetical protein
MEQSSPSRVWRTDLDKHVPEEQAIMARYENVVQVYKNKTKVTRIIRSMQALATHQEKMMVAQALSAYSIRWDRQI